MLAARAPKTLVIDLSHAVPPQDVLAAARILDGARGYFAPETLFLVVVDPGVGTDRAILYAESGGQAFLVPDNGLLGFLDPDEIDRIVRVARDDLYLSPLSATFHGRDVFAPVAAWLATGGDPAQLGDPAPEIARLPLPIPKQTMADGSDRFWPSIDLEIS